MFEFLDDEKEYSYINATFSENEILYIDSNIFMDDKAIFFLNSLTEKNKVIIPQQQYNELYKLKSSADEEKAYKARNAFKKIEELYDKKILKIDDLSDLNKYNSYADPIFIRLILQNVKNKEKVAFITEDRDLRLRLKIEIEKNTSYANYLTIYTLDDVKERISKKRVETSFLKKSAKVAGGLIFVGAIIGELLD